MRIFFCFYLENSNILLYYDNIGLPQASTIACFPQRRALMNFFQMKHN